MILHAGLFSVLAVYGKYFSKGTVDQIIKCNLCSYEIENSENS